MENNINNNPDYQKILQEKVERLRQMAAQGETINQKIGTDLSNNENFQTAQTLNRDENELNEKPEVLEVPENFKELEREEQIELLKEYMEKVSETLLEENKQAVIDGNYEIKDISYNELADGSIVLDVEVKNGDEIIHEQFNKDLKKIDIDKEIEELRENDKLTPELEEQMNARKQELEDIKDNPEKISLNELETEKTLEDDEKRKKLEQEAENIGIDKGEINGKNCELDDKGDPKFKADMLQKFGNVTYIEGKGLASHRQTFNEITGQDCDRYAIFNPGTGYKMMGIKDGKLVDLSDKIYQDTGARNVSFTKADGTTDLAASLMNIRFRQAGSGLDGKYSIGIAALNGRVATYMGREGTEHNQIVAQEFPRGTVWNKTYEIEGKDMLDTRMSDEKINNMTDNMEKATKDNIAADTSDMLNKDDIVKEYADYYGVDIERLDEGVDERIEDNEDANKTVEELVKEETDEILEEEEEKEQGLNDHGERDIFAEMEEEHLRNLHKPQD